MTKENNDSLPLIAVFGLTIFVVAEALYMPLVFGKMSVTLTLIIAPFLTWSLMRGSKLACYALIGLICVGTVIFDLPLILFALGGARLGFSGSVFVIFHGIISIALGIFLATSSAMKDFFASKANNPFGVVGDK